MNSMPFRQLKSFFKILIGVQYERQCTITKKAPKSLCIFYHAEAEKSMILSLSKDVSRVPAGQGRHPVVVFRRFLGNQPLEAGAAAKGRNSKLPAQRQKSRGEPSMDSPRPFFR